MTRTVTRFLPFPGGAALVLAGVVPWLGHLTNPLADDTDNLGQPMLLLGTPLANVWCIVVGTVVLLAGAASLGRPGTDPRLARRTMTAGTVLGLLTLDQTLLAVLGYLPMMVWFAIVGDLDRLDVLLSPGLVVQVLVAAAAARLGLVLLRGWRPSARPGGDRLSVVTQQTRKWTLIAIEAPLVYALSRTLMFFEVPGFRGFPDVILWAGLGLAAASVCGAWLTWGLIRPWGERFPRWMVGLAGRSVPIGLAVVPALVVATLVATASRAIIVGMVTPGAVDWDEQGTNPLILVPQILWPLWAYALAMAALNYRERRQLGEIGIGQPATTP